MKKIPTSEIVAYDWKSDGDVWTQPTSRFNNLIQAAFFDQMKGITDLIFVLANEYLYEVVYFWIELEFLISSWFIFWT